MDGCPESATQGGSHAYVTRFGVCHQCSTSVGGHSSESSDSLQPIGEDWRNAGIVLLQYVTLEPDHAPSQFALALCYDNLGQFERALVHYNMFMELDDGSDDVRSFQVGQRVESIERYLFENR